MSRAHPGPATRCAGEGIPLAHPGRGLLPRRGLASLKEATMFRTCPPAAAAAAAPALAVIAAMASSAAAGPPASATAGPTADPVPVGHNQSFAGLVFGSSEESMIEVLCAGPV